MRIKVKELSFSYTRNKDYPGFRKNIDNINIEFEQGMFYSILGPNGSGKTTFLDLLTGYLKPDSGGIFFDNQNISSFSKKEMAKKTALVSQDYYINFPYTVREVVSMGRHPYIGRFFSLDHQETSLVDSIARRTGISDLMDRKITCLSGGERQRSVFARALCQKTPVLLLDEAFSNMDINHTFHLLHEIKKEISDNNIMVISVSHDLNFASIWSDRILFLKNGKQAAFGTPDDVLEEEIIKKVYDIEARIEKNKFVNAKQVFFNLS